MVSLSAAKSKFGFELKLFRELTNKPLKGLSIVAQFNFQGTRLIQAKFTTVDFTALDEVAAATNSKRQPRTVAFKTTGTN